MIATRMEIVEKAREYLGTPFHHQARLKKVGVDCIGLIVCVANELGFSIEDCTTYSRKPSDVLLLQEMRFKLDEIPKEEAGFADVLLFWISRTSLRPQHIAYKTDIGLIHTWAHAGKVVETPMGNWDRRICGAFRLKGVA